MESIILALHIVVCVLLVILILLQSGKEGMGVIFGGGNTSVFGSSGAGSPPAKEITSGRLATFKISRMSEGLMPLILSAKGTIALPPVKYPQIRLALFCLTEQNIPYFPHSVKKRTVLFRIFSYFFRKRSSRERRCRGSGGAIRSPQASGPRYFSTATWGSSSGVISRVSVR